MRLAIRELRRQPGRFATAGLILVLIAALLVFLGGLSDGLNGGNDGAVRAQQADLVVISETAERSLPQSLVTAEQRAAVEGAAGVAEVGGLSLTQLGARLPDRDLIDVAVFGTELALPGMGELPGTGSAWADRRLEERGVAAGDTLLLGPDRTPVVIEGFLDGTAYQGQPTVWLAGADFDALVSANKPDEVLPPGADQALLVRTAGGSGASEVAAAVDGAATGTETVTRLVAADAIEDVDGGVLAQIILLTVVIAAAVVALFFALLTGERVGLYGVLKAIGARSSTLFAGVVAQAVVLTVVGAAVAAPAAWAFDALVPPDAIPFDLTPTRLATSVALLLAASVVGASLSLRRVLRTDPASAIGAAS